jgi:deoxyribodipyrimidine photo-lyase
MGTYMRKISQTTSRPYLKFTPFYEFAKKQKVHSVYTQDYIHHKSNADTDDIMNLSKISNRKIGLNFSEICDKLKNVYKIDIKIHNNGGRKEALKLMNDFNKKIKNYKKYRDFLEIDASSHLGAHLHFGTISPREVYHKFKNHTEFIKQLYWREFYMYIVNYVSVNYNKKSWTLTKFNNIQWNSSIRELKKWQHGKTGIPIVDAGMRELLTTGYMHNRARMICAMYLIHYLGIHWKEGEKWFAQNLMDYSYANNYGGWVWCAGTEVHSNPYFRIYSMVQQHKRFDKNNVYIYKWCPELKDKNNEELFKLYDGLEKIRNERITFLKKFH